LHAIHHRKFVHIHAGAARNAPHRVASTHDMNVRAAGRAVVSVSPCRSNVVFVSGAQVVALPH
jgi:hypothetical protein